VKGEGAIARGAIAIALGAPGYPGSPGVLEGIAFKVQDTVFEPLPSGHDKSRPEIVRLVLTENHGEE